MKPFVKNAADKEQVQEAGRKLKSLREQELNDIRTLLLAREGRRFYWRLLGVCGVFKSSFIAGQLDHTAFMEGQRNIGLRLIADLNEANPEAYLQMITENKKEEEKDA